MKDFEDWMKGGEAMLIIKALGARDGIPLALRAAWIEGHSQGFSAGIKTGMEFIIKGRGEKV